MKINTLLIILCFFSFKIIAEETEKEMEKIIIDETEVIASEAAFFRIEKVAENFIVPWSMEFISDTQALIADREAGLLKRLDVSNGNITLITGLPQMLKDKKISSGLFDIRVHPDFAANHWVYVVSGAGTQEANGLALTRFELIDDQLVKGKILLETSPRIDGKWHFGGRLVLTDRHIYMSTGEGYKHSHLAQDLSSHSGKILRLFSDGSVPEDNPFVGQKGAQAEIWSYGIRSPQGLAVHPDKGDIWFNEHGPQGGDEVNIAGRGLNYGWPLITYGEEYGGGPVGEGATHKKGMQQPVYYWRPSIAPSGMHFYEGDQFPGWNSSVFIGALALKHINRLVVEDERVLHEERILEDKGWRIRFVKSGPDGMLYFGIDKGLILRLVPAPRPPVKENKKES